MNESTRATSAIASMAAALILFVLASGGSRAPLDIALSAIFALLGGGATFAILSGGKINRIRFGIFILSGIAFLILYSLGHQVHRGSILLSDQVYSTAGTAICPIALPTVLVPYALLNKMIFSTTEAGLFSILFLWLSVIVIMGRGWCGWICFFGWIDQFFSSLLKRPVIKIQNPPKAARLFPYAFMLFLILISLVTLEPVFCGYMCPLRIIYDPPVVNSTRDWIIALIFVTGGLVFLVIGPMLTKKRIFCSFICPLRPFNSVIGVVSPFKVKVDKSQCKDCGLCIRNCELGAITKESLAKGETTIDCAKCGKCIDSCPAGAIDYKLIATDEKIRPWFVAIAVVFSILMLSKFIGGLVGYMMTGNIKGF